MAAGEITYDNSMPVIAGNRKVIHGTIEVDNTARGFAICDSKSTLVHASLEDEDGTAGYFGITPVFFCSFCLTSMVDMVTKLFKNNEKKS